MKELPELVLASSSPYRRRLLERLRVPFVVLLPGWGEVRLSDPDATVRENALGKARSVAAVRPSAAVLASDQVAYCSGKILEKPGSAEHAREQIAFLAGREHSLHTAVALRMPGGEERVHTVLAHLSLRPLPPDQIAAYVRMDSPLDCAGSYRFEALGIVLFESIRCDDPTSIEGLPLIATRRLLEEAGWTLLSETGRGGGG